MASLANQTISSTYDGLVKTSTDQPVPISGVQLLEDGVGNSLALSVGRANQGVTITGTLTATSISGVLADGVTATTQSLGDNSTKVATTAFVKSVVTAEDLDIAGDSGTGAVDLDSQSLTISGTANEIETSASGQAITIGLPSSVTVGTLTATTLAGTLSTAAQTNITSVGTLSSLAVSGNVTIGSFLSGSDGEILVGQDGSSYYLFAGFGADVSKPIRIGDNPTYISIHTANSERLRIDSSGNVGIGTSSPVSTLEIAKNDQTNGAILSITNSFNGSGWELGDTIGSIDFRTADGSTSQKVRGQVKVFGDEVGGSYPSRSAMSFSTANLGVLNERMRIDTNGNVLIGATSYSGFDSGGFSVGEFSNTGATGGTAIDGLSGSERPIRISTTAVTDRILIDLYNPNGRVGAIKTNGLGIGIGFGGSAAANTLDDYEEGTWTPVFSPTSGSFTSVTYDPRTFGTYTKIGNTVYVQGAIRTDAITVGTAEGILRIDGLPFTINSTIHHSPTGAVSTAVDFNTNNPSAILGLPESTQLIIYYRTSANGGNTNLEVTDLATGSNSNLMRFNIFYTV